MKFTAADIKTLIREELTATDKNDIERMIKKQLKDDLEAEVKKAFSLLKEYRESRDEPGEPTYIETFFKDKDDNWKPLIDTVDREHLAALVEEVRVMASADGAHMFEME